MTDYQGFPISNFRTGFSEQVEPWLLPRDAFQVLQNAHLYRGVVEKINGYDLFAKMSYRQTIQMTGAIDGVNKTFTATLTGPITTTSFIAQGAINGVPSTAEIFTYFNDASPTLLNLQDSVAGGSGTIDITNPNAPVVTITFNTAPTAIIPFATEYNAVIFTYDTVPPNPEPIMGIEPYFAANGSQTILIFDTLRAGQIVAITSPALEALLLANNGVEELPHQIQAAGLTLTNVMGNTYIGTIAGAPLVPGEVTIYQYDSTGALILTITDNGVGGLFTGATHLGAINYFTGQFQVTFTAPPPMGATYNSSACIYGNTFSGDYTDFFSVTNYKNAAFITNNVDPIRFWNGACLMYLDTNLEVIANNVITYDITSCLFVQVYRDRLLLVAPVVDGTPELNTIYWSTIFNPFNFTNDEFLPAPTSEPIRLYGLINTDMIVRFSNSERVFRYTQDAFNPFRWDSTNNIWRCDTNFSAINYDSYYSSVCKPAIVGSDGVNIRRVDEIIPDFTDADRIDQETPALFMSQTNINLCYGERFDDLKEGWLCYRSYNATTAQGSNAILAFNYLDETYAVYTFPFSCLGYGTIINAPTWATDFRRWDAIEDTWGSYQVTGGALVELGGDQFGNVFLLDDSNTQGPYKSGTISAITLGVPTTITDTAHGLSQGDQIVIQGVVGVTTTDGEINNIIFPVTIVDANNFTVPIDTTTWDPYISGGMWFTAPVVISEITKNFNPFIEDGQLARLGYLDLLVSANNNTNMRVQFYINDELYIDQYNNPKGYYQETMLTFLQSAPNNTPNQTKVWKRIYVGAVGKSHTIRFYQNLADFTPETLNQPVRIHAMVPYFKPAGRIFN